MTSLEKAAKVTLVVIALGYGAMVYRTVDDTDDGGPSIGALCIAAPALLLLLIAGPTWKRRCTPPASRPRARRGPGTFCTQCGRDLSGEGGGRCPECGTSAGVASVE